MQRWLAPLALSVLGSLGISWMSCVKIQSTLHDIQCRPRVLHSIKTINNDSRDIPEGHIVHRVVNIPFWNYDFTLPSQSNEWMIVSCIWNNILWNDLKEFETKLWDGQLEQKFQVVKIMFYWCFSVDRSVESWDGKTVNCLIYLTCIVLFFSLYSTVASSVLLFIN